MPVDARDIFQKTFGGLSKAAYVRHLFFSAIITVLYIILLYKGGSFGVTTICFSFVNFLLYPYSRFSYETIVGFILGNNLFFVNALMMLVVKAFTMLMCWVGAVFFAPLGLAYLYYHHSRG